MDIQGLRAVCMMQVLAYHAWSVGSPIGVDAFIMISAYLMTSSFVRRTERGRMPFFVERWVNTFKRLLPPLVATVLVTVAVSMVVLPRTRWGELITQGIASVTYWQNWRLAEVSADYFAANRGVASPLQHLWSMSMQGQVFLAWPLLMAGCVVLARVVGVRPRKVVLTAFLLAAAASLYWLLAVAPRGRAVYFDTRARVWEFALGSAVAAAAPWIRPRGVVARVLSWAGFVTLVVYCVVSIGRYPGPMAAVPMVSVSVILLADAAPVAGSVQRLLSWRPLVALGDMSYSVYLIHWPVFVLTMAALGRSQLGAPESLGAIALSLGLAWLMRRFVDGPAQEHPRGGRIVAKKTLIVVASLATGLGPLYGTGAVLDSRRAEERAVVAAAPGDPRFPGPVVLGTSEPVDYTAEPIPGPLAVHESWVPDLPEPCPPEHDEFLAGTKTNCSVLPGSYEEAPRVVVVGDSHAQQTIIPLATELAERHDWQVAAYLTGSCAFGIWDAYRDDCVRRNEVVLDLLTEDPPDIVMVQSTQTMQDWPGEIQRPGVQAAIEYLTDLGIIVIGVRDNPRSSSDLYECSSERPADSVAGGCVFDQYQYLAESDPAEEFTAIPGFVEIDPTDLYCIDGECYTIIGNVYVYMDNNHINGTYSRAMAPELADRVDAALDLS
ncbi:acyltransferase [Propionibacterium australiense]|uniref:Acyltransferase n=2 Tax=Propionibacterium australiense TaxID=119981 RepID=A0A8B3FIW9_9ACTN|nr:acyltransferase [Propionibacterium australiense]